MKQRSLHLITAGMWIKHGDPDRYPAIMFLPRSAIEICLAGVSALQNAKQILISFVSRL
jgi:hypothetical protein